MSNKAVDKWGWADTAMPYLPKRGVVK